MRCVHVLGLALVFASLAVTSPRAHANLVGPKIIQTTEIPFPVTIDVRYVATGAAAFIIDIDADGKLVDWLATSYTAEDFVRGAVDGLKHWRYEPARQDGQPVGCRTSVAFEFQARGKVILTEATGLETNFIAGIVGPQVTHVLCRPRELDRPVVAVRTVTPLHPGAPVAPTARGRALVDFIIDEQGQPRMPVIIRSTEGLFGEAAVDALTRWRFQPPTRRGRPVIVRVQEEFVFPARS